MPGGRIDYISKNKIRWTLNENLGIWIRIEGDEDAEEVHPIVANSHRHCHNEGVRLLPSTCDCELIQQTLSMH